jgi:hypothetical protein
MNWLLFAATYDFCGFFLFIFFKSLTILWRKVVGGKGDSVCWGFGA